MGADLWLAGWTAVRGDHCLEKCGQQQHFEPVREPCSVLYVQPLIWGRRAGLHQPAALKEADSIGSLYEPQTCVSFSVDEDKQGPQMRLLLAPPAVFSSGRVRLASSPLEKVLGAKK